MYAGALHKPETSKCAPFLCILSLTNDLFGTSVFCVLKGYYAMTKQLN